MIGTTLSHFKITAKLGEGGMGEVWRAQDSKLGREVAIKLLPETVSADPERLARFEREAKLLAALNHPNIAAIYGIEEAEGKPLLVLELVEGETLAERLNQGPLAVRKTLELAQQIALALEEAHAKGVIHRDLKPANVKLTPNGRVKVLDFGLAKAWDVEETSGSAPLLTRSPTLTQHMTEAGVLLGTAAYMSPEQARGKPVDKRADIWAFGCVLLEMLTGRKAFGGDTITDMIAAVVAREPDWSKLPTDTPAGLSRLLRRCLEKDADQRLRDIGDARLELEELLTRPESALSEERVAVASKASRLWVAATAVVGLLAVGLGITLWLTATAPPPPVVRAFIPAPPGTDFNLGSDYPAPVALSPDGSALVFGVSEEGGIERLWVRDLDELEARPLAGTEAALYPFWSPDSRHIGFFAGNKLKKIEVTGGPAMSLCDAPNGKGGTWNRDGVIVFAPSHNAALHRVSAAGGEAVELTELVAANGEDSHRHPRFLPDGEHFLFVARSGFGGPNANSRVMLGSLSGETTELMPATSNVEYAAGHLLYVFERTLMARPFDAKRRQLTGDAFPLAERIWGDQGALLGVFSASETGVLAYQTGTPREAILSTLQWRGRDGKLLGEVGAAETYSEVSLSPDWRSAVVSLIDADSGNRDLWLVDLERQLKTRFTFDPAQDWIAVWSPDGERIAFSSERGGTADLYVKSVTGGGEAELVFDDDTLKFPLSWSQDGQYLLYEAWGSDGGTDIYALALAEGSQPIAIQPTKFVERAPVIAPNGRWLAYVSDESGRDELYVTAFPGGGRKWQVSTEGTYYARWSRDGREIFLLDSDGTLHVAEVDGSGQTFQVGRIVDLFDIDDPSGGFGFDVTADGQQFLVTSAKQEREEATRMEPMTLVVGWTQDLRRP